MLAVIRLLVCLDTGRSLLRRKPGRTGQIVVRRARGRGGGRRLQRSVLLTCLVYSSRFGHRASNTIHTMATQQQRNTRNKQEGQPPKLRDIRGHVPREKRMNDRQNEVNNMTRHLRGAATRLFTVLPMRGRRGQGFGLTSTVSSVLITSILQSNRRWVCFSWPTNPSSSKQAYLGSNDTASHVQRRRVVFPSMNWTL